MPGKVQDHKAFTHLTTWQLAQLRYTTAICTFKGCVCMYVFSTINNSMISVYYSSTTQKE